MLPSLRGSKVTGDSPFRSVLHVVLQVTDVLTSLHLSLQQRFISFCKQLEDGDYYHIQKAITELSGAIDNAKSKIQDQNW